ncbi:MAG: SDR family oxidoreductase [Caldilineaceae bacterium]|nr:SDR family oxidoreductase [Caldilineaceae bacterium]
MEDTIANVRGKKILITGAAQGIGEAAARLCAARGATVLLVDVKADKGEAVAASIRESGGDATFYAVDIRDDEAVQALFAQVGETHGYLDVIICAAGVLLGAFLQPEEFPVDTFDFVMEVNVRGTFLCTKYATPLIAKSERGVMILIASGAGVLGGSSSIAYGTSKGAVHGMSMVLAGHLASRNIRVNAVCPGGIATEMKLDNVRDAANKQGRPYEDVLANANLGDPAGVAKLLAYLASDDGDYVRRTLFTR